MKRKLFFAAMIFLAMSLFARNGITVQEFSAIATSAEGGELSVKIADVLNKENQRMLVTSCINSSALVTLDLSDCSFEDDEREINFFHIKNVKKCSLPLSTKSIEYFDCDELEEIELPDGLEKIQCQAFFDAKKLMYVRIPASVKYVGACAFGDCDSLWYIQVSPDADLHILRAILSECEDYWVKMKCTIVYNDGTKTDLEGSARLYFVPFWL